MRFEDLVGQITQIGVDWHGKTILENTRANVSSIGKTIRSVKHDRRPCVVVSAGPSLYRQKILPRLKGFAGTIVATDGAYIQCLRHDILPDWVITIDPHPTRMVRWFGDPDFDKNMAGDDYFARQDLDVSFRENQKQTNLQNIDLVDENMTRLVISCTSPVNVVERTKSLDRYWFAPLVDDPESDGLTRQMIQMSGLPAMNTGGTVGTAAWVFASQVLQSEDIAVVGMDFGYYLDTPLEQTQSFHMLKGNPDMYPQRQGHWGEHYTDPTYAWYLQNFLDLLKSSGQSVTNCSEAGLLNGENVHCMGLGEWLAS